MHCMWQNLLGRLARGSFDFIIVDDTYAYVLCYDICSKVCTT